MAIKEIKGLSRKWCPVPSSLCDIEKGRKVVSPERAARFAKFLGRSQQQFLPPFRN